MPKYIRFCVLSAFAAHAAFAVDLSGAHALFDAGAAENAARLLNADEVREVSFNGAAYLEIRPDRDPYSNVQWRFEIPRAAFDEGLWTLEITFFDKGAGVIDPVIEKPVRVPWRRQSYTRLNTLRERKAYFEMRRPLATGTDGVGHLEIEGLQYLKSIRALPPLTEAQWKEAWNSVPKDVTPMVTLERPVDLVTTAGVASKGIDKNLEYELSNVHELAPLAKVLGFNAIELYMRWNLIEGEAEGKFDFSYYDAIIAKIQEYGLQIFPLLIVGSAYALPEWFIASEENVEFVCLEHGLPNLIQSIWSPYHKRHVTRVLQAIGAHYEPMGVFRGVRIGPSGNYGESQYPAGGNWPAEGREMHIHIGLWSGDEYARADFRRKMAAKYGAIAKLNAAWNKDYASFEEIPIEHPLMMVSKRQRADYNGWYTRSMSEWCEWWALETKKAMPHTKIYQSAGGWGFLEAGTSYTEQTQSMTLVSGGVRLTNETDSFEQNFYATRLAVTAARLYGVDLGYEPASSHTARGVAGRLFGVATANGDHFFTYHPNIFYDQYAIDQWLTYLPVLDMRAEPVVDVAVYYPETFNQLEDSAFRHLYAWGFNPRAREARRAVEVDYLDDKLIREGFLDRYKALVFVWGNVVEQDVLEAIDAWLACGGVIIYPSFPRGPLETVEGDDTVFSRWEKGDTGSGAFHRFPGDMEPPSLYGEFIESILLGMENLHPWTKFALRIEHPEQVFFSIQQDGHLLALNYNGEEAAVRLPNGAEHLIPAYGIARIALPQ